uniref:Uncharacterized protein n=1 Tax=Schistosoma haematobium TaxID=6185 RepID=A0A095A7R3_SCHHA
MTICLDHLLHAAQIKSDATYLIEPISTTTTNNTDIINEEYQSNLNELSNSLFIVNELNDLSSSSSPQLARSILQIILMDINKSDDILAHFESYSTWNLSDICIQFNEAGPSINLDNAVHRLESCGAWRGAVKLCLSVARSRDPSDIAVDCLKRGRRPSSDPLIDFDHRFTNRSKLNRIYAVSELAATEGRKRLPKRDKQSCSVNSINCSVEERFFVLTSCGLEYGVNVEGERFNGL